MEENEMIPATVTSTIEVEVENPEISLLGQICDKLDLIILIMGKLVPEEPEAPEEPELPIEPIPEPIPETIPEEPIPEPEPEPEPEIPPTP